MTRSRGTHSALRKAKTFALTKHYKGRAKNCYSIARNRLEKALQYSYVSRRLKKRDMRSLWITRISAGSREYGMPYSHFMNGLAMGEVALNRKILAQLAIHEPATFKSLAQLARAKHDEAMQGLKPLATEQSPHIFNRTQMP